MANYGAITISGQDTSHPNSVVDVINNGNGFQIIDVIPTENEGLFQSNLELAGGSYVLEVDQGVSQFSRDSFSLIKRKMKDLPI